MRIERVEDIGDGRVAPYRGLKDADLAAGAGRAGPGRFMAEGELVVRRLIGSRYGVESALVSEKRIDGLRDALETLPGETPVYVAPQGVMDAIVGFHIHRGVLAVGRRGAAPSAAEVVASLGPGARMVVVLETIANHDNMGGLFRNAAALGADAILLTARCSDPMWRKSIRVSMGSVLLIPFGWMGELPEAYATLRGAGFTTLAMTPRGDVGAVELESFGTTHPAPERVALVVGAEGPGLSDGALREADERVRIGMAEGVDSLNVATAAAVGMYALRRGRPGGLKA